MNLQDALKKIIRKYGTAILGEKRLVFLLEDYRAFSDYPAVKPVMKVIAEDGYGIELSDAADTEDSIEFAASSDRLKETLTKKHGFRKDFAEYAVGCISFAMGFGGPADEPLDHGFDPAGKAAPESRKDKNHENSGTSRDEAEKSEGPESAEEQYQIGLALDRCQDVDVSLKDPASWYLKAAEQGHADAQYRLGWKYALGEGGVEYDSDEAVKWWLMAARQGHTGAQCQLASSYLEGEGVEKNVKEAVRWYRKASELGDTDADKELADMYRYGRGVEKNPAEAVKWYRKALDAMTEKREFSPNNEKEVQTGLADMYMDGAGVEKNAAFAVRLYREAADQGDSLAQYRLGMAYKQGDGIEQDNEEAVHWFQEAVNHEFPSSDAQYELGMAYWEGRGVEKDHSAAVEWFTSAAENDCAAAQHCLGMAYKNGDGIKQDDGKAGYWLRKAAVQWYADTVREFEN